MEGSLVVLYMSEKKPTLMLRVFKREESCGLHPHAEDIKEQLRLEPESSLLSTYIVVN